MRHREIDDDKRKTELTAERLEASVITSLRIDRNLTTRLKMEAGPERILEASAVLHGSINIIDLLRVALKQIEAVVRIELDDEEICSAMVLHPAEGGLAFGAGGRADRQLASHPFRPCAGVWWELVDILLENLESPDAIFLKFPHSLQLERPHMTVQQTRDRRRFLRLGLAAAAPSGVTSALAQTAASGVPLKLGVLPNISARVLLVHYQPMREYLEQTLGRPVQVVTANDFRTFAQATREGLYDMVVTAPNLGRMAQRDSGWVPLAQYEPGIPALLVASASNRDTDVSQLKRKSLALANPQSLVALVGLRWLGGKGLVDGRDFQVVRTPNDDSLGAVLLSGEAPFAIMSMGEFRAKPEALRQSLQIVTEIATVPGFLVMANPAADRQKLGEAMAAFPGSEAGRRFFALSGFSNMKRAEASELAALDPYVEATRRALFGEN